MKYDSILLPTDQPKRKCFIPKKCCIVIEISMIRKFCQSMDPTDKMDLSDLRYCIHGMCRKFYPKKRYTVRSWIVESDGAHLN